MITLKPTPLCCCALVCMVLTALAPGALAHDGAAGHRHGDAVVGDWTFVPAYALEASGANLPEGTAKVQPPPAQLLDRPSPPMLLQGKEPTDRLLGLVDAEDLPTGPFTVELWLNNHINQPVGAVIAVRDRADPSRLAWALTYYDYQYNLLLSGDDSAEQTRATYQTQRGEGHREYWWHVVGVYDQKTLKLYANGALVQEIEAPDELARLGEPMLEMAAYLENEPYMQWANLVHAVRVHERPLSAKEIEASFEGLERRLYEGRLHDGRLHYTAPPYLNHATLEGINLLWETDRDTTAVLHYGPTAELGRQVKLDKLSRLHELTVDGLEQDTPYFYRVVCTDVSGSTIDSGPLTFRTAVGPGQSFKFAVIGDTETRPHINARLAELIWQDRPNFVINVGDLTDGGHEPQRWQWTHEYFVGMGALHSRIPLYPVPGNGEGDLHWYKHYHRLPGNEAYYTYRFGDAEFFMLDSNQREHGFAQGGEQNRWLREQMGRSDAVWKFAAHHHATLTSEEDDYGDRWKGGGTDGDPAVQRLVPIYEQYNLDIVFFGHLHLYERSRPMREGHVDADHGVVHLLAGGGGGHLEDFAPTAPEYSDKTFRGHHYVLISITGRTLSGKMYDLDGRLRDHFQWTKPDAVHAKPPTE